MKNRNEMIDYLEQHNILDQDYILTLRDDRRTVLNPAHSDGYLLARCLDHNEELIKDINFLSPTFAALGYLAFFNSKVFYKLKKVIRDHNDKLFVKQ